jgi:hypothetical protein
LRFLGGALNLESSEVGSPVKSVTFSSLPDGGVVSTAAAQIWCSSDWELVAKEKNRL